MKIKQLFILIFLLAFLSACTGRKNNDETGGSGTGAFDDLETVTSKEMMEKRLPGKRVISVSAKEKKGIELLEDALKQMFFEGRLSFNDEVYITNMRHKAALMEALDSLKQVESSIEMQMPEDFYSIDLMAAYEALGRIIGEAVGEDLVNEIFGRFCMGK